MAQYSHWNHKIRGQILLMWPVWNIKVPSIFLIGKNILFIIEHSGVQILHLVHASITIENNQVKRTHIVLLARGSNAIINMHHYGNIYSWNKFAYNFMHAFGDQIHAAYEIIWVSFFTLRIQITTFNVNVFCRFPKGYGLQCNFSKKKGYNTVIMFLQKSWVTKPPNKTRNFFHCAVRIDEELKTHFSLSMHIYHS